MANRKPSRRRPAAPGRKGRAAERTAQSGLGVRRASDGRGWVLVHPRCARDRADDLEEVRAMVAAGELDVAIDELRWLVGGCSEFVEAHALLGELALAADDDLALARGHFGFAVQSVLKTLERAKVAGPLSYRQPANRPFYEAGRALAACLAKLDLLPKAVELIDTLVKLDPTDPLDLRKLLDELRAGDGPPTVDLRREFRRPDATC